MPHPISIGALIILDRAFFFFNVSELPKTMQEVYVQAQPDTRIVLACAIHGKTHRHLRDCALSPNRLEVGKCQKDV